MPKSPSTATDTHDQLRPPARAVSADGHEAPTLHLQPVPAVVTDRERLRTVLVNLLTNAQHAVAAAGQPTGEAISVTTMPTAESCVAILVRDRGPGISPDDMGRIFDPYFTTRRGGTGLGLAISKNIVEGLGGTLTASSLPGEGAEFRVELGPEPPAPTH